MEPISKRQPVIDQEIAKELPISELQKEWLYFTETIRRDILQNPDIRRLIAEFANIPLSEGLPKQCVDALSAFHKKSVVGPTLEKYIGLPEVPDHIMKPGLRMFERPYHEDINHAETDLILQRYVFARDIKTLALMAEMLIEDVHPDESDVIHMKSGIEVLFGPDTVHHRKDLLDPTKWKKRMQLKDRVYVVTIGDRKYILKERKTWRHKDVARHLGLTSREEFIAAQDLNEKGTLETDDVKISWEKSVCAVTYPDGYQFALFELEENYNIGGHAQMDLEKEIVKRRLEFNDEYERIKVLCREFSDNETIMRFWHDYRSNVRKKLEKIGVLTGKDNELSFEDYAAVRAQFVDDRAMLLICVLADRSGYSTSDAATGYRIREKNGKLQFECITFDLELFSKRDEGKESDRQEWYKKSIEWRGNNDMPAFSKKQQSMAYLAMLKYESAMDVDFGF